MHSGGRDSRHLREGVETTSGAVTVHSVARSAAEDGTTGSAVGSAIDRTSDGRRQRHERDLVALAVHAKDAVPVDLFERLDVSSGRLEDPQAQKPEHGDESEVVDVRRRATGAQHRFELKMVQPQCG